MANGKISGDPLALTTAGLNMAAIQAGANVQAPSTLFAASQNNLSDLANPSTGLSNLGGLSAAAAAAAYQPLDSDLTAIAALVTTAYGRALLELASATALQAYAGLREVLTAARTYYVRTDGSNSNTGLVDSAGGAFLTIQKAVDTVSTLDIGANNVAIQVKDGTFTGTVVVSGPWLGSGTVTIQGNSGTPANVLISITSGIAFTAQSGARLVVKDMKITTTGGGTYCLYANGNGVINFTNIDFGVAGNSHMRASDGGLITCDGNYAITGAAVFHWRAVGTGVIRCASKTVTITGTPAFGTAFASAVDLGAMVVNSNTFSGSATGVRYDATINGVIDTAGGGATYLPGGTAGTTATGGQYA